MSSPVWIDKVMNESFASPPKVRRVFELSPRTEDGKTVGLQTRYVSNEQFVPIFSQALQQIPVTSPKFQDVQTPLLPPQLTLTPTTPTPMYPVGKKQIQRSSPYSTDFSIKTEKLLPCHNSSSIDMEGTMVDIAIDSVISHAQDFSDVLEMQKDQSNEIQRQQALLKSLQETDKEVTEKKENITEEITGVTQKIYLIDEQKRMCNKKCQEYEIDMKNLVVESEKDRNKVEYIKEEIEQNQRQYDKYRNMIKEHKAVVEEFESNLDVIIELKEVQKEVALLENNNVDIEKNKLEAQRLLAGQLEDEPNDQINAIKEDIEVLKSTVQQKVEQLQEEKAHQNQVQVSLNVLQKKNLAKLTRLKKQVKAAQQSSRQWNDQISQLQKSVDELNYKLGQ